MLLQIFGATLAAMGTLMIFTHGALKTEDLAMKQLFIGIMMALAGILLIFYSPF